jgi:hypothetical protein
MSRYTPLLAALLSAIAPLGLGAQGKPYPLVLGLPATARYAGLANAGVAVHGDAGAIFINPAGIATIRHGGIEGTFHYSHSQPLEGTAAAAFRVGQFTLGGGAHYLRLDPESPNADNLLGIGTLVYRYGIIAGGFSGKYVSVEDTLGNVARSASADAGVLIAIFDILAIAASFQNIGHEDLSGAGVELPHSSHLGFVFNFTDPQLTWLARIIAERVWPEGSEARNKIAAEVGVQLGGTQLVLRGGTGEREPETGQSEQAVGATLGFKRFTVDYAYQAKTALGGDVQRIGVRFTL